MSTGKSQHRFSPLSYSAQQVLEQALGFRTTEGHVVLTKKFTEELILELDRLRTIEEAAASVAETLIVTQGKTYPKDYVDVIITHCDNKLLIISENS